MLIFWKDKWRGWPPELKRFPQNIDAQDANRDWWKRQCKSVSFWVVFISLTAFMMALQAVLMRFVSGQNPLGFLAFIVVGVSMGGGGITINWWFGRHKYRRFLRERLNEMGVMTCMKCGYDLTGNESGVCPECGSPS